MGGPNKETKRNRAGGATIQGKTKGKKRRRQRGGKKAMKESLKIIEIEKGKRKLVEVLVVEGITEELGSFKKKRKRDVEMKEVVVK